MKPPRLAHRLLLRILTDDTRDEVEGDLQEAFDHWITTRGPSYARRRYWREVVLLGGWRVMGSRRVRERKLRSGVRPAKSLAHLGADVRFACRRLLKNPLSSAVAILLLAIGIGGNAAVFTVVDEVLLEAPPGIRNPEELVGLGWTMPGQSGVVFGYYDYLYYRDQGEAFVDVLAYGGFPGTRGRRTDDGGGEVVVGRGGEQEQAGAWLVSGNYFQVLGTPMALGSGFGPGVREEEPSLREVVVSQGFWSRSLGRDRSVLDRTLYLNGEAFRIVGVVSESFRGINPGEPLPDLFLPIRSAHLISQGFDQQLLRYQEDGTPSASRFLRLVARLSPGYDLVAAQTQAAVLQSSWMEEFGDWTNAVYGGPYQLQLRGDYRKAPREARVLNRQLYMLWFVVAGVLLIGCGNLAVLLLARASGREQEMGIRASLGAGRGRIFGQLVTESLVLSILGGLAGLIIAYLAAGVLPMVLPLATGSRVSPDGSVIAFALLLAAVAALLFGTAPAWALSRTPIAALVQRPGQGRSQARFRGGLVVVQTALSVVLLIGGALLVRSVQAISNVDLGWDPENRLVLGVQLATGGYSEEEGIAFLGTALDRLAAVPGVRLATVCNRVPFLGSNTLSFTAPGTDFAERGLRTGANLVGPDYLETLDIRLVAGRPFTRDDGPGTPLVGIVNEAFAARMWPGEDPLGKTLDFFDEQLQVVGVAETVVYYNVTEAPRPHVYIPSLQVYMGMQNFIVATEPPLETMVPWIEDALRELDSNLALASTPMEALVDSQLAGLRVWTGLVAALAGVALLMALVGLYGVQSYLVSRKAREVGIRMALGARAPSVVGRVVGTGLAIAGLGALLGVAAALALSGLVRGFLFGVSPLDPWVLSVAPALMLLACAAASLIPALRASRVDPVQALSRE